MHTIAESLGSKLKTGWITRITVATCLLGLVSVSALADSTAPTPPSNPVAKKDWTFLVFLNGNNNLDRFGTLNMNQMEKVGSSEKVNIVVQWASLSAKKTRRVLVQKDNDATKVTSPVIQDMGQVDMGDWRNLVEFVRWGAENYPAEHYFINVWDHGSGWHAYKLHASEASISPTDISWDDNTGHSITTKQLGQAMAESARIIGHKVDVYGSDACLMAMAEVAGEMSDSVKVFVGSQEVEPGEGWPYDQLLSRWSTKTRATPADVGRILTEEYHAAYSGGQYGNQAITFSAMDLENLGALAREVKELGRHLEKLDQTGRKTVVKAIRDTLSFTYSDYGDLGDYLDVLERAKVGFDTRNLSDLRTAIGALVIANKASGSYAKAQGVSLWLPYSKYTFNTYKDRYSQLAFGQETQWGITLGYLLQDAN
jgi:hypothetical protein